MKHTIVCSDPNYFFGWPANIGIWSWGDEIAVGFTRAWYVERTDGHSIDPDAPMIGMVARSLDGGETWDVESPEGFPEGFRFGQRERAPLSVDEPIDFTHPDLAIRCRNNTFLISRDRCRTWTGPFSFSGLGTDEELSSRTDYIVQSPSEALFFLSAKSAGVRTAMSDRAFVAATSDGGITFNRKSRMMPDNDVARSVMPSTVRVSPAKLVSALRRKVDLSETEQRCWIDSIVSTDNGESWELLGEVAETGPAANRRNGNPPSLAVGRDGRLVATYGYRSEPFGIRSKISSDEGKSWSDEIVLRSDARTFDIGYVRSIMRTDGKMVSTYYYTTEKTKEQHIAATIWDPSIY